MSYLIRPCRKIKGVLNLPGDKSISHRAIILSSIANGLTKIKNLSFSDDCNATLKAFQSLGVKISKKGKSDLFVYGVGLLGLKRPKSTIDVCESGTSMRILTGLLCAQNFKSRLDGETSLRSRPMLRVIEPLRLMGANIRSRKKSKDEYPHRSLPAAYSEKARYNYLLHKTGKALPVSPSDFFSLLTFLPFYCLYPAVLFIKIKFTIDKIIIPFLRRRVKPSSCRPPGFIKPAKT